ncbi:hypothetical protein MTO96_010794 [Rhipicephalus appendiculatus]
MVPLLAERGRLMDNLRGWECKHPVQRSSSALVRVFREQIGNMMASNFLKAFYTAVSAPSCAVPVRARPLPSIRAKQLNE